MLLHLTFHLKRTQFLHFCLCGFRWSSEIIQVVSKLQLKTLDRLLGRIFRMLFFCSSSFREDFGMQENMATYEFLCLFRQMLGSPESKPSFLSDKNLEPVIKAIQRKFPAVDTKSNSVSSSVFFCMTCQACSHFLKAACCAMLDHVSDTDSWNLFFLSKKKKKKKRGTHENEKGASEDHWNPGIVNHLIKRQPGNTRNCFQAALLKTESHVWRHRRRCWPPPPLQSESFYFVNKQ